MRYTDDGPWHLAAEEVGHVQKVPSVVCPGRIVAEQLLVELVAIALVSYVGDQDATDTKPMGLRLSVQITPYRLVDFFRKSVAMHSNYSDVARLGIEIVLWAVLFDVDAHDGFLRGSRSSRPFPQMLRGDDVLYDFKGELH
ncbi:hypothetical protein ANO14919_017000 [Xylariales sp. No.14919]|nr:hypothetical protein ANO14919_017000 [Xylariales sp. No.14919]